MFRSTAILLVSLAVAAQAAIDVTTPSNDGSLNLCEKYTFNISGDSPGPYYGFIVSGEDPCGPSLKDIGPITGNTYEWTVDVKIPEGKTIMLAIENDGDVDGYSGKLQIKGSNSACIAAASSPLTSAHSTATVSPNNAANDPSDASAASRSIGISLSLISLVSVAAFALAL